MKEVLQGGRLQTATSKDAWSRTSNIVNLQRHFPFVVAIQHCSLSHIILMNCDMTGTNVQQSTARCSHQGASDSRNSYIEEEDPLHPQLDSFFYEATLGMSHFPASSPDSDSSSRSQADLSDAGANDRTIEAEGTSATNEVTAAAQIGTTTPESQYELSASQKRSRQSSDRVDKASVLRNDSELTSCNPLLPPFEFSKTTRSANSSTPTKRRSSAAQDSEEFIKASEYKRVKTKSHQPSHFQLSMSTFEHDQGSASVSIAGIRLGTAFRPARERSQVTDSGASARYYVLATDKGGRAHVGSMTQKEIKEESRNGRWRDGRSYTNIPIPSSRSSS